MQQKLKAILLDLDGTLIDSIPLHIESFHELFEFHKKKISRRKIRSVVRLPSDDIYVKLHAKKILGLSLNEFIFERRHFYYSLIRGRSLLFPHAFELLKELKKKKFLLALVTNSSRITTVKSTPKKALGLFDVVVAYDDVKKGKPDPKPVLLALKKLHVKAGEALMAGDSVYDMTASRKAGVKERIGVVTGVSSRKELMEKGARIIINDLVELRKFT
ncbi:MAG: HAD-IA family hydrolase [Candidatus Diapherotrites archaeon]